MIGLIRLAFLMLYRDRAKYLALVGGLAFCTFLIAQQAGVFCGVMLLTTSTLRNVGANIWVADSRTEQINSPVSMRDIEVNRVRSLPGVAWAVPIFLGVLPAKLPDGSVQNLQIVGVDSGSFVGAPKVMIEGDIQSLLLPEAVIMDQVAVEKFASRGVQLRVGSRFEINDQEASVVGFCRTKRSFSGFPHAFTTYEKALQWVPPQRKLLSFILVQAKPGESEQAVVAQINGLSGLRAFTTDGFRLETMRWFFRNTGIPVAFSVVVIIGAVFGLWVTGQAFFLFVHDNLRHLAAMAAMGATQGRLAVMVMFQAFFAGAVGYGVGLGLTAGFGFLVLPAETPAFYLPWQLPVTVGALVAVICFFAGGLGVWKLRTVEPAMVFK
jgi:putative ABC transport system permease protein